MLGTSFFMGSLLYFSILLYFLHNSYGETTTNNYQPDWNSLETRPLPDWFDNAKIGIFIHWGIYSVPSVTSEWFWFDWMNPLHNEKLHDTIVEFMEQNYEPGFTYQNFGPLFTAELFNATEWIDIISKSGARYVVLTSKHHDGFALWPTNYSYSWNSMDIGPHKDIVGELSDAIRKSKYHMKFGLYHSLYEWFNPLYISDKSNNFSTQYFVNEKIFPEMKELVEKYKPEIFWSDGEAEAPSNYWRSEEFIAWLYNESPISSSVVVNDRWGAGTICKHGGYLTCTDRYSPGHLQKKKWENAMTLDKNSWGYNRNSNLGDYLSNQDLIDSLVETVALGGNILINIGPTSDGRITPIFQERLHIMGQWLTINGAGIYNTKPWALCQNDTYTPNIWYTRKSSDLYVVILRWPRTGVLYLSCPNVTKSSSISMLGYEKEPIDWIINENKLLKLSLPAKNKIDGLHGWTLKVTKLIN